MLVSKSQSDNRVLVTRLEGTFLNTGFIHNIRVLSKNPGAVFT